MSAYIAPDSELYSKVNFDEDLGCQQNVTTTCNGGCATAGCSCGPTSKARASQGEGLDSFEDVLQGEEPEVVPSDPEVETHTDAVPVNEEATPIPEEEEVAVEPEMPEAAPEEAVPEKESSTNWLMIGGLLLLVLVFVYFYMGGNKQIGGSQMEIIRLGLDSLENNSIRSL